jgi:uncharacterized protein (TIGR03435 family)
MFAASKPAFSSEDMFGLPNWAKNETYAVSAKPPDGFLALPSGENREQVRLMMRAMLADRFHLQVHTEARRERISKIEIARPARASGKRGPCFRDNARGRRRQDDRKQVHRGSRPHLDLAHGPDGCR